jgi:hypothetical protein
LVSKVGCLSLAVALLSAQLEESGSILELLELWCNKRIRAIEIGGDGRLYNLNSSISVSLSSPLVRNDQWAIPILQTLALLPEGLWDDIVDMRQLLIESFVHVKADCTRKKWFMVAGELEDRSEQSL